MTFYAQNRKESLDSGDDGRGDENKPAPDKSILPHETMSNHIKKEAPTQDNTSYAASDASAFNSNQREHIGDNNERMENKTDVIEKNSLVPETNDNQTIRMKNVSSDKYLVDDTAGCSEEKGTHNQLSSETHNLSEHKTNLSFIESETAAVGSNNNNNRIQNSESLQVSTITPNIVANVMGDELDNRYTITDSYKNVPVVSDDNQSDEATDVEDEYGITEDQRRAMMELEMLKRELDYVETEPPEYNVKDRLKALNEELDNEPELVEKRSSKVMFKDDLVDFIVPPPEDSEDESKKGESEKKDETSQVTGSSNKVLIEREGKFELVHPDDVRALDVGFAEVVEDTPASSLSMIYPHPPSEPRPQTADGLRPNSSSIKLRRVKSAPLHGSCIFESSYASPYGLTAEQKKELNKQMESRMRKQMDDENTLRQEKEDARRRNEEAFEAWLSKKRDDNHKRQKENKQIAMQSIVILPDIPEDVFGDWLSVKKKQKKEDKLLRHREEMDNMKYCVKRSQDEIDTAYKSWLRQKAYEARKARLIELMRYRARYLIMKRQKKMEASRRRVQKVHPHSIEGCRF